MTKRVVLSGCSGGGKSTLIAALADRGFSTFPEAGRQVVREELARGGTGLPWLDNERFTSLAIEITSAQWYAADAELCFFDRSVVDLVTGQESNYGPGHPALEGLTAKFRYFDTVFLTPPWEEIFVNDTERRHSFADAVAEYNRLLASYPAKGYHLIEIPKAPVEERVDWLLEQLE